MLSRMIVLIHHSSIPEQRLPSEPVVCRRESNLHHQTAMGQRQRDVRSWQICHA